MDAPKIQTAIPRRRYRLGEYEAVVLDEIQSSDAVKYRYVLALVREGESRPSAYVTSVKRPRAQAQDGAYALKLITEVFSEEVGASDAWGHLDKFSRDALALAARSLGLGDEQPVPLM